MIIFNYADLATDKAVRAASKALSKAGAEVAGYDLDPKVRKSAGIAYRQMDFSLIDGQQLTILVKESGDIFQVKLNGQLTPIKEQTDQAKAIVEIAGKLIANRVKFQKKLAAVKVVLPPSLKTAAPRMEQILTERNQSLDTEIAGVEEEIRTEKVRLSAA